MHYIKLYFRFIANHIKVQLQYRVSFLLQLVTYNLMPIVDLCVLFIYFNNFQTLAGWSAWEVAMIYSITSAGFGFAETFARGFDTFPYIVKLGRFDRMLLRPVSTVFQVFTHDFPVVRLTRVLYSIVFIFLSLSRIKSELDLLKLFILLLAIVNCALLFTGLNIIIGAFSFLTINPAGIKIFTDGSREIGKYPISAYPKWFALFYVFMIPIGCVTYFPLLYILEKPDLLFGTSSLLQVLACFTGVLFLILSFFFWFAMRRKYMSTGS